MRLLDKSERIFASVLLLCCILIALILAVAILAVKMETKVEYGTRVCVQDSTFTVACHEIERGQ